MLRQAYRLFFLSTVATLIFLVEVAFPFNLKKNLHGPGGPYGSSLAVFLFAFFPGNLAAMFPFSIDVLPEEGIRPGIPFRKVRIPIGDVIDVDLSSTTKV